MTRKYYWTIANALRKVRQQWGLTDNVNTRDEALFNDVVDTISRSLGRDNSGFSPEKFNLAIYGNGSDNPYSDPLPVWQDQDETVLSESETDGI